jgi:hypothetical protein
MGSLITRSTRGLDSSSQSRLAPGGQGFFFEKRPIGKTPMTVEQLISLLAPILPNLLLDEERDGEVIVYTGFREDPSGTLVEVTNPA